MFKIPLKVYCNVAYLSAELKKLSFIFKAVLPANNDRRDAFITIMAHSVQNNLCKFRLKISNYIENNDI